ncbi:MAG TPA: hypothetical protein VHM30_05435 [Gemmatimonadaceae bacterium]|nr:hypothetical protein [Gemmatimonadaceae bacterium]
MLAEALEQFSVFGNLTAMKSEVSLGAGRAASTNAKRSLVGQSPYVLNTGLTYSSRGGRGSATLLYNRVGDRVVAAGSEPLPDMIEHPRDVLDFSLRLPLGSAVAARLDAKNLLDARYRVTQGTVTTEAYNTGRALSLGFTWQP